MLEFLLFLTACAIFGWLIGFGLTLGAIRLNLI
jgi:hypothetical protein